MTIYMTAPPEEIKISPVVRYCNKCKRYSYHDGDGGKCYLCEEESLR